MWNPNFEISWAVTALSMKVRIFWNHLE